MDISPLLLRKAMDILARCIDYTAKAKAFGYSFSQEFTDLLMLSHGTNPHSHFTLYELFYGLPDYTDIRTKSISHFLLVSSIITLSIIPKLTCQTLEK